MKFYLLLEIWATSLHENVSKNLSGKYGQKTIQKIAEGTAT